MNQKKILVQNIFLTGDKRPDGLKTLTKRSVREL